MILCAAGLAIGTLLGLAAGGRPADLARWSLRSFRWLVAGVIAGLWVLSAWLGLDSGGGLVLAAGLGVLAAVALANLGVAGLGVVAVGLVANLVPVLAEGATPVDPRAVEALQARGAPVPHELLPTQRLDRGSTLTAPFASRIPVPVPGDGHVASFGDLVLALGLAATARSLVLGPPRRGIPVSDVLADGPLTIDVSVPTREPVLDLTRPGTPIDRPSPSTAPLRRGEHPVEVNPGEPVPVPLGWERIDPDDDPPPGRGTRTRRVTRRHPTMRLAR